MFNPERLLGGLISEAIGSSLGVNTGRRRRRGFGGSSQAAVGMGLLGLAVGAFEHFTKQSQGSFVPQGGAPQGTPPPQSFANPPQMSAPPPIPSAKPATPPPPPPKAGGAPAQTQSPAVLLIRSMFAAAAADGVIDDQERKAILDWMSGANLSAEEKAFVEKEMLQPMSLQQVLGEVQKSALPAELREQLFVVSLLGIHVDTPEEQNYLTALGQGLGISPQRMQELAAKVN